MEGCACVLCVVLGLFVGDDESCCCMLLLGRRRSVAGRVARRARESFCVCCKIVANALAMTVTMDCGLLRKRCMNETGGQNGKLLWGGQGISSNFTTKTQITYCTQGMKVFRFSFFDCIVFLKLACYVPSTLCFSRGG